LPPPPGSEAGARVPRPGLGLTAKQAPAIVGGLLVVAWLVVLLTHHNQLQPTLFGVDTGALVAAVALSATLTYRGSGVVNFSVAAMAMYASFIFYDLWQYGAIFFPPPFGSITLVTPPQGSLGSQPPAMGVWWAFAGTMVVCAVMGLLFHLLIFRPLRNAPPLAKVAASIGLYLVLFSIIQVRFPMSSGYSFPAILPAGTWTIGAVIIPKNQGILVLMVLAVAAVLWAIFRYTRFGLATRAAAENQRGAMILGYNPNLLAAINWVASTMLAGAFGLFLASIQTTITPYQITLLIVPALAAALVGRFRSFPVVVVVALLFGASQQWILAISVQSWFPSWLTSQGTALQGLGTLIPFVVILVVLFFRGERLPSRGSEGALRMPKASEPRKVLVPVLLMLATVVVCAFTFDASWRLALATSVIAAVLCASLTILTGFMGQVSLMQMTIGGVAAFVLSKFCDAHHIPFPLGPIIAAGAGMIVGLLAAVPALRIRGVNLAIATLAAGVVIEQFVYFLPIFLTGYTSQSQANVAPPSIFGFHFGPESWTGWTPNPVFIVFCAIVLGLAIWAVVAIRRSQIGRRMLAVRSNERAAAAVGVDVARTKMLAFAISAFIAGIGGTLFAYLISGVDVQTFSSEYSLLLIAVAYLGGIAVWEGAAISGVLFQAGLFATFLSNIVHINSQYAVYIAGIGLIVASINNQEGISGSVRDGVVRFRAMKTSHRPPPVSTLATSHEVHATASSVGHD
jgi:branched-chain amino acid transport system permease protein